MAENERWPATSEGWLWRYPSNEAIAYAKRERAQREETPNLFEAREDDLRWTGHLAEHAVKDWLASEGLPFVHNGGVDQLPDFSVCGLSVAVKCRTATGRMYPDYVVNVPVDHMRHPTALYFFACFEKGARRMLLLGAISKDRFRRIGKLDRTPHPAVPGDFYEAVNVAAGELQAPADVAAYLRTRLRG